jgi:hypothetical protein
MIIGIKGNDTVHFCMYSNMQSPDENCAENAYHCIITNGGSPNATLM